MRNERTTSERLLHGAGVIMTVFGVLELLLFAVYLGVVFFAHKTIGQLFSANRELIDAGLFAGAALTELIAGILGMRCVKTYGRTTPILIFGVLCLGLTTAALVLLGRRLDFLSFASLIVCAVVPVVFLIAAVAVQKGRHADA